mmetsp:Transcript_26628/g.58943  ORF Transcript_26628/g.58943 Transcript_26628/m.58943 type:complete len:206 (-) Transcript_26628:229-846(-)
MADVQPLHAAHLGLYSLAASESEQAERCRTHGSIGSPLGMVDLVGVRGRWAVSLLPGCPADVEVSPAHSLVAVQHMDVAVLPAFVVHVLDDVEDVVAVMGQRQADLHRRLEGPCTICTDHGEGSVHKASQISIARGHDSLEEVGIVEETLRVVDTNSYGDVAVVTVAADQHEDQPLPGLVQREAGVQREVGTGTIAHYVERLCRD